MHREYGSSVLALKNYYESIFNFIVLLSILESSAAQLNSSCLSNVAAVPRFHFFAINDHELKFVFAKIMFIQLLHIVVCIFSWIDLLHLMDSRQKHPIVNNL